MQSTGGVNIGQLFISTRILITGLWNYFKRYWCPWGTRLLSQSGSCAHLRYISCPGTDSCFRLQRSIRRTIPNGDMLAIGGPGPTSMETGAQCGQWSPYELNQFRPPPRQFLCSSEVFHGAKYPENYKNDHP